MEEVHHLGIPFVHYFSTTSKIPSKKSPSKKALKQNVNAKVKKRIIEAYSPIGDRAN
jgi:hypothetical protein